MNIAFKAFRGLNHAPQHLARIGGRIDERFLAHAGVSGLTAKLVEALAEATALPVKEVVESFEFFERVRRRVRGPHIADVCCGHGLTGMLFAVFERRVERVTLLDKREVDSQAITLDALAGAAPWIRDKVRFLRRPLREDDPDLADATGVVAVHACGARTDRALGLALQNRARLAVMPCCHNRAASTAPAVLIRELGVELATDIARTYRLEEAGYLASWSAIPPAVTPMGRIVLGVPRG